MNFSHLGNILGHEEVFEENVVPEAVLRNPIKSDVQHLEKRSDQVFLKKKLIGLNFEMTGQQKSNS